MKPDPTQPVFIPPGSGTVLDFLRVTHKLTSAQTGGTCCVFEAAFDPGDGNRLHVHRREDEIGYVLQGALEVRLGDRILVLEAGGVARLPRDIPHALRNPLDVPSRYLFMCLPGGLDQWFDAVASAKRDGALDDAESDRLSSEFEIGWLE